jgi:hypothetical protein
LLDSALLDPPAEVGDPDATVGGWVGAAEGAVVGVIDGLVVAPGMVGTDDVGATVGFAGTGVVGMGVGAVVVDTGAADAAVGKSVGAWVGAAEIVTGATAGVADMGLAVGGGASVTLIDGCTPLGSPKTVENRYLQTNPFGEKWTSSDIAREHDRVLEEARQESRQRRWDIKGAYGSALLG